MSFVVEHDFSFQTAARTNTANATPQLQIGSSGFYDWIGGLWASEGGGCLSCPVTSAGNYSVAPNITFVSTGQGSGTRKAVPQGTCALSGTNLDHIVMTFMGLDYVSTPGTPTLSGGTGSGGALGTPVITKNTGAGTLGCTNGSAAVVGTSTNFTTDVIAGEDILINGVLYNILSVTDNTHLTLSTNFGQTTASGLAYSYGGNVIGSYANLNSVPSIAGGYPGDLVRPASIATVDQQADIYFWVQGSGGGSTVGGSLRTNFSIGTYGEKFIVYVNSGSFTVAHYDGTSTVTVLTSGSAPSTWVIGHLLKLTVSAVNGGTSTCTLTGTLVDVTAGNTTIGTVSGSANTSTTYPNLAAAGQVGVTGSLTGMQITRITTYNTAGISSNPSQVGLNIASQTLNISGLGTNWLSTTPTLGVSGGGASFVSQTINSNTSITLVINTGSTAANCTITDPSTGFTTTVVLQAIIPPSAVSNVVTLTTTGATITASTFATFGNANFTYLLYRCPRENFLYTDSDTVLVSTQSGVPASTVPTAVVDTSVSVPGVYYWSWVVTDSSSQTGQGNNTGWRVPAALTIPTTAIFIGDSLTSGHDGTATIQQINTLGVTGQGSGQTNGTYNLIFTGGLGTGFAGKAVVSGGLLVRAHMTAGSQGHGQTSESTGAPTITYSGAGGTPGTISSLSGAVGYQGAASANTGGGFPMICTKIMQQLYGFVAFDGINAGVGGINAAAYSTDSGGCLSNAKDMAVSPSVCPWVHIMLGANDANSGTTPATYGANLASLVGSFTALGYRVLLSYPLPQVGAPQTRNQLLQEYQAQVDAIVAANPGAVYHGWKSEVYGQLLNTPEAYVGDGVHLNDYGYSILAAAIAKILAAVYSLPGAGAQPRGGFLVGV